MKYPSRVWLEIREKLDVTGIIIGAIAGFIVAFFAQKTILKSELLNRKKIEEKKLEDNKLPLN